MMRRLGLLTWAACVGLILAGGALAQSPGRTAAEDDVYWESVSGCTDAIEVKLYIEEFGEEGRHVAAARACLEKLRKAASDSTGKKTPSTEVERLLEVCEMHFAANRLTTGVGGTAVQCYREVQSLDPANRQAVEGLQRVFGKYADWARAVLERGDASKARGHVERLKGLNPEAPEVAELEGAIARLETQTARTERECDGWNTKEFFETATPDLVTQCLRDGADLNDQGQYHNTPLHYAAWSTKDPDVVTVLLKAGADPNEKNRGDFTPLHAAALNENPAMSKVLLEAGSSLQARNEYGHTPLLFAARGNENPAIISELLKAGADLHARGKMHETPLHLAARHNQNPAVTAALLKADADPKARDEHSRTPLHWAAENNTAVIDVLVKAGADPNVRDRHGNTPLHRAAAYSKNPALSAALIEADADPNARNRDGETPLDYALRENNRAVIDLLSRY